MLGPAPFRFIPAGGATPGQPGVEGPAFSWAFRLLAIAIVLGCALAYADLWHSGKLGSATTSGSGWFALGLLMMGWTLWSILFSRTRLDADGLYQRWLWDKRMPYCDLAYGRVIRIPGLDWLIAPRLYVRTMMGKFSVFYGATPELVAEFERLVHELKAFRRP